VHVPGAGAAFGSMAQATHLFGLLLGTEED
jgi:hypothetical protein